MNLNRIKHLARKELAAILRDVRTRMIVLLVPALQLLVFSYAAVIQVKNIPTAVLDLDHTRESREVMRRLEGSGYFKLTGQVDTQQDLHNMIMYERASVGIIIPGGYGRDLAGGKSPAISFIVDGTQSNTALVIMGYIVNIMGEYGQELLVGHIDQAGISTAAVYPIGSFFTRDHGDFPAAPGQLRIQHRIWYNPGLSDRFFYIPGVLGLTVILVGMMITAMMVVREKEEGTLEQMIVTPIKPMEIIMGKALPITALLMFSVSLQLLLAFGWFRLPLEGSLAMLYLVIFLFLINSLGVGLFISTISSTQQQAMLSCFFYLMPAILLSGFLFPVESMPRVIQYLTWLNPYRYFIDCTRAIMLRGVGFADLENRILLLSLLALVTFIFSALRFQKRLS